MHVVDLCTVESVELVTLWEREIRQWRERLLWDVSGAFAAFRRSVERGGLSGKVVRVDGRAAGYAYYVIAGRLGVLSSPVMSPESGSPGVAERLLQETIGEIRAKGVQRIESPFVSIDCPWLAPTFEGLGFRTHWREFLRINLDRSRAVGPPPAMVQLEPWWGLQLDEAAGVMQAAYDGGVDAEIYLHYRTAPGCRVVLDNLLNQGTCGSLVAEATMTARQRGRAVGFVVVTEIAPYQAHLPQIVVVPDSQGRGIGRALLDYSVARLTERHFETLSLIVSRANMSALRLYQTMGFQSVLAFPVFTWER